jgi:hypothetical protein
LVDPGFVGERVPPNHRLVVLDRVAGQAGDHARCPGQLLGSDADPDRAEEVAERLGLA